MGTRKPFPSVCKYLEDGQPVGEVPLISFQRFIKGSENLEQKLFTRREVMLNHHGVYFSIMESTSPVMVPTGDIYICAVYR